MSRESSIDQPQGSLMADVTCIATRWRRGFLCEGRNGCIRPWMKRLEYFLSPSGLFDIDDPLQGLGRESCISPPMHPLPCSIGLAQDRADPLARDGTESSSRRMRLSRYKLKLAQKRTHAAMQQFGHRRGPMQQVGHRLGRNTRKV